MSRWSKVYRRSSGGSINGIFNDNKSLMVTITCYFVQSCTDYRWEDNDDITGFGDVRVARC